MAEGRARPTREIAFRPARVLMQDFTGVPAVVDLAAMRDAMARARRRSAQDQSAGAGRSRHRPLGDGRLSSARPSAFEQNVELRIRAQRRALRVPALGRRRLRQLPRRAARHRHLPPGQSRISGADGVDQEGERRQRRSPSPTRWSAPTATPPWSTASRVLGWGVGGIEAEAAMLGQPISMLIPEVIGFRLDRQAARRASPPPTSC